MPRRKTSISLQDIAAELGISRNAAALALAGKPGISDELRQSIGETAVRLGYRHPSRKPISGNGNFLVLAPEFLSGENAFYAQIYQGIEQGLKSEGQHLMYASVTPAHYENKLVPAICRSINFRGIILVGAMPPDYLDLITGMGLPIVLVDNNHAQNPGHAVCIANNHGLNIVTRHLIECGHKDIGFIGPIHLTQGFYDRWTGYRQALEQAGLAFDPGVVITTGWRIDSLHERPLLLDALEALPRLPQALVCATDMIALNTMAILSERGLRIPEDISITGFDDIQAAHLAAPPLTTYRVPRQEMGREAAQYVCQLAAQPQLPAAQRTLYGRLQERASVRRRPA